MLTDGEIIQEVLLDHLGIEPFDDGAVQAVSVDLRLGNTFFVLSLPWYERAWRALLQRPRHVSLTNPPPMRRVVVPDGDCFSLPPGGFALAETLEYFTIPPDRILRLEGRSSLARLGLSIHRTAATLQPGWRGRVTLELVNDNPDWAIDLYPGVDRVAQVFVECLTTAPLLPYGAPRRRNQNRYQNQEHVTPARLWRNEVPEVSLPDKIVLRRRPQRYSERNHDSQNQNEAD